jgi:hypothetical protein
MIGKILTSNEHFYIGHLTGYSYSWDGLIDEVRIYSRALSEQEIKQHYYAGYGNLVYKGFNIPINPDTGSGSVSSSPSSSPSSGGGFSLPSIPLAPLTAGAAAAAAAMAAASFLLVQSSNALSSLKQSLQNLNANKLKSSYKSDILEKLNTRLSYLRNQRAYYWRRIQEAFWYNIDTQPLWAEYSRYNSEISQLEGYLQKLSSADLNNLQIISKDSFKLNGKVYLMEDKGRDENLNLDYGSSIKEITAKEALRRFNSGSEKLTKEFREELNDIYSEIKKLTEEGRMSFPLYQSLIQKAVSLRIEAKSKLSNINKRFSSERNGSESSRWIQSASSINTKLKETEKNFDDSLSWFKSQFLVKYLYNKALYKRDAISTAQQYYEEMKAKEDEAYRRWKNPPRWWKYTPWKIKDAERIYRYRKKQTHEAAKRLEAVKSWADPQKITFLSSKEARYEGKTFIISGTSARRITAVEAVDRFIDKSESTLGKFKDLLWKLYDAAKQKMSNLDLSLRGSYLKNIISFATSMYDSFEKKLYGAKGEYNQEEIGKSWDDQIVSQYKKEDRQFAKEELEDFKEGLNRWYDQLVPSGIKEQQMNEWRRKQEERFRRWKSQMEDRIDRMYEDLQKNSGRNYSGDAQQWLNEGAEEWYQNSLQKIEQWYENALNDPNSARRRTRLNEDNGELETFDPLMEIIHGIEEEYKAGRELTHQSYGGILNHLSGYKFFEGLWSGFKDVLSTVKDKASEFWEWIKPPYQFDLFNQKVVIDAGKLEEEGLKLSYGIGYIELRNDSWSAGAGPSLVYEYKGMGGGAAGTMFVDSNTGNITIGTRGEATFGQYYGKIEIPLVEKISGGNETTIKAYPYVTGPLLGWAYNQTFPIQVENVTIRNETGNGSMFEPVVWIRINDSDKMVFGWNSTVCRNWECENIGNIEEYNISSERRILNTISNTISGIWNWITNILK